MHASDPTAIVPDCNSEICLIFTRELVRTIQHRAKRYQILTTLHLHEFLSFPPTTFPAILLPWSYVCNLFKSSVTEIVLVPVVYMGQYF